LAASLSVRVQYGASPGTQSAAVTGIDFISADNATTSLANRQANPITIPGSGSAYSYEKWVKLYVDTAPANGVTNFLIWSAQGGSEGAGTGVTINAAGAQASYASPVSTASSVATSALPTTSGSALQWDASSYTTIGDTTQYAVLQLVVGSTASQGNMTQATVDYSYDET
jgi:hypothetical protein